MTILIIDVQLPTLNQYISAMNSSRYTGNAMKKKYTDIVQLCVLGNKKFKLPKNTKFNLIVTWHVHNNMSDHDNIQFGLKFALDGIVKSRRLKNDSPRFIGDINHKFRLQKTKPYTWSTIEFKIYQDE